jgi:DNA-directed RNA polymerase specialized sigma24 family protein
MKYDEIAEAMDEPVTTIRTGLFRARKQLRELLRQMAGEDGE